MQRTLEDRWIPVGLTSQFLPASAHPVVVNGNELVVWASESGRIQAWEDRCPHRGMRLSFGFIRGERLTCLYHGWTYGADGRCARIPAHPDLDPPRTICTKSYSTACNRGIVYVNMGGQEATDFWGSDDPGWYPVRSIFAGLPADAALSYLAGSGNLFGAPAKSNGTEEMELRTDDGADLALAVQPVWENRTAVHVTSTVADPNIRAGFARRLVAMRRELEQLQV